MVGVIEAGVECVRERRVEATQAPSNFSTKEWIERGCSRLSIISRAQHDIGIIIPSAAGPVTAAAAAMAMGGVVDGHSLKPLVRQGRSSLLGLFCSVLDDLRELVILQLFARLLKNLGVCNDSYAVVVDMRHEYLTLYATSCRDPTNQLRCSACSHTSHWHPPENV